MRLLIKTLINISCANSILTIAFVNNKVNSVVAYWLKKYIYKATITKEKTLKGIHEEFVNNC